MSLRFFWAGKYLTQQRLANVGIYGSVGKIHTGAQRLGFQPIKCSLETGKEYKWCACGLSKKQPFCDGSHKTTNKVPIAFKVNDPKSYMMCCCKQSAKKPFCDGTHKKLK